MINPLAGLFLLQEAITLAKNEKRMVQNYEVRHTVQIAGGEVIFAEDKTAEHPYMVCNCDWDNPLGADFYTNGVAGNDFVEMIREFSDRITARTESIMTERAQRGIPLKTLTAADCESKGMDTDLEGRVVVIKPEMLSPEYRFSSHQIALCTGGFGAKPNARGRAVSCTNLYTGKSDRWNRSDVAGTLSPDRLPDWARDKLAALQKPIEQESVLAKIREGRQTAAHEKPKPKKRDKGGPEL